MEEKYPCPKLTPKKWIENFWYYYKWMFLVAVVFITFITIATVQYFTKNEADVSILYVGSQNLSEKVCEDIILTTENILPDQNGDGVVKAELKNIKLTSDLDALNQGELIEVMEDYRRYSDEILGGEGTVLLLDEYFYKELADSGSLINLYEIFPEMPAAAFDYYGLRLGKTPLYKQSGFSSLPEDTVLCFKYTSALSDADFDKRAEMDVKNLEVYRLLFQGYPAE